MFKTCDRQLIHLLFPFMLSLCFATEQYRFNVSENTVLIPELYLNFSQLNMFPLKGDSLYIKIGNDQVEWDLNYFPYPGFIMFSNEYWTHTFEKGKINPYKTVDATYPNGWFIFKGLKGNGFHKLKGNVLADRIRKNILSIPVNNDFKPADRLRITNLPIKFLKEGRYPVWISKDEKNWIKLDYMIHVGWVKIDLDSSYNFIANSTQPQQIGITLDISDSFIIPENTSVLIEFSGQVKINTDHVVLENEFGNRIPSEIVVKNDNTIEWIPKTFVGGGELILFNSIYITDDIPEDNIKCSIKLELKSNTFTDNRDIWETLSQSEKIYKVYPTCNSI